MVTLNFHFGLDVMPDETQNYLIAPKISTLTSPNIPDISANRKIPFVAFIFNFPLSMVLDNQKRQLVFNISRKMEDAHAEYNAAYTNLKNYVASDKKGVTSYFAALRHFEHCLAHIYQAVCCMNTLSKTWGGPQQFDKKDGSILERLSLIHADIKHMDDRFEHGPDSKEINIRSLNKKPATSITSVPMWLTNEGLESIRASVSYAELAEELIALLEQADELARTQRKSTRDMPVKNGENEEVINIRVSRDSRKV